MKKEKKVFISLVNWSNWEDTFKVVNQLLSFNYDDLKLTIGVVDNDSPNDSFLQLKENLPQEVLLTKAKSNAGYAAGHAINLELAKNQKASYFWVLNSDVELFESTLSALLEISDTLNNKVLVGSVTLSDPQTIDFGGSAWKPNDTAFHYNDWKDQKLSVLQKQYLDSYRVQSLEGSSLLIPMSIIEAHGFIKTDFFMYGEETDYCMRLDKNGIPSYISTRSVMIHKNEGSLKHTTDAEMIKAYYRRRNHLRIQREHFGMTRWNALAYPNGILENIKSWVRNVKDLSYHYALGSIHAAFNKKGKTI